MPGVNGPAAVAAGRHSGKTQRVEREQVTSSAKSVSVAFSRRVRLTVGLVAVLLFLLLLGCTERETHFIIFVIQTLKEWTFKVSASVTVFPPKCHVYIVKLKVCQPQKE